MGLIYVRLWFFGVAVKHSAARELQDSLALEKQR